MTRTLVALLVVLSVLPSTAAELRTRLHRPSRGLQVRLHPFDIQARTEREVCQLIELPNTEGVELRDLTIAIPAGAGYGSHHFAMFLYAGGSSSGGSRSTARGAPGSARSSSRRFSPSCSGRSSASDCLRFGVTSEDEMCFAVGFFYLDEDRITTPPVRGCYGEAGGLVCPFSGSAG